MKCAKRRGLVADSAISLKAEVYGTVREAAKGKLALGLNSVPIQVKIALHNHALPPEVVVVRDVDLTTLFVDISYVYPFKSGDDVPNKLREMFQKGLLFSERRLMFAAPAAKTRPAQVNNRAIHDVIDVKETVTERIGQEDQVRQFKLDDNLLEDNLCRVD